MRVKIYASSLLKKSDAGETKDGKESKSRLP